MAIAESTILFEDYFESVNPLANYEADFLDRLSLYADMYEEIKRGDGPGGNNYVRFHTPTLNCPNCDNGGDDPEFCGTTDAGCYFGQNLIRRINGTGVLGAWRHLRFSLRLHGPEGWFKGGEPNNPSGYTSELLLGGILYDEPHWVISFFPDFPYESVGVTLDDDNETFLIQISMMGGLYEFPVPWGEWVCFELATSILTATGESIHSKAWVNGELVVDGIQTGINGHSPPEGLSPIRGFSLGNWGGFLVGNQTIDIADIAWSTGPIGCSIRGGVPIPEPAPDPDAKNCRDDNYDTECVLAGACGRVMFDSRNLTRDENGWETFGNGFPAAQSAWFSYTPTRSGRYIWRTRGSEIFNEIGVYRHTGALPPPLLAGGFSDEDEWDPDPTTSSAVEVELEAGVEYRIRVASASDGWIVLDWGRALGIVQDDGWSVSEEEDRETLTRVDAVGPASGMAVQDSQVATNPSGAGTEPTMGRIVFGEVS